MRAVRKRLDAFTPSQTYWTTTSRTHSTFGPAQPGVASVEIFGAAAECFCFLACAHELTGGLDSLRLDEWAYVVSTL